MAGYAMYLVVTPSRSTTVLGLHLPGLHGKPVVVDYMVYNMMVT